MSKVLSEVLAANAAYASTFGDIPIDGYVYAVESGRLVEVPEAIAIGRSS